MQNVRPIGNFQRRLIRGMRGAVLTAAVLGLSGAIPSPASASTPMRLSQLGKRMGSPRRFFQNVEPAMEFPLIRSADNASTPIPARSPAPYEKQTKTPVASAAPKDEKPGTLRVTNEDDPRSDVATQSASGEPVSKPQLLPDEEGTALQRVPTETVKSAANRLPNKALREAIKLALPGATEFREHDGHPATDENPSPNVDNLATAAAEHQSTINAPGTGASAKSARNLAIRHLTPSRYFQPGEPTIDIPSVISAEGGMNTITLQHDSGISQVHAYRPVPPNAPPTEDVPPDPTATPIDSKTMLLRMNTQGEGNLQDGSTNPIPPSPAPEGSTSGGSGGTVAEADKLGSAPENNSLQFLRSEAVLLQPGQCQFDFGLTYSVLDTDFPIALVDGGGDVVDVAEARTRQRQLVVPFAVRYGLSERIQLFANVPVGWASTEVAYLGIEDESNVGGLGDIDTGASVLIKRAAEPYSADVIATISLTAPTGITSFPDSILDPADSMGEGYWGLSQSLLFIHTIDPVVLFYGVGYKHRFDRDFGRTHVDPGEEINYQFGAGFSVNPWVTLSGAVIGAHLTSIEVDDLDIEGSGQDPMRLRLSVTAVNGRCIIEPFAEVAMTDDSPSRVGVVFTY